MSRPLCDVQTASDQSCTCCHWLYMAVIHNTAQISSSNRAMDVPAAFMIPVRDAVHQTQETAFSFKLHVPLFIIQFRYIFKYRLQDLSHCYSVDVASIMGMFGRFREKVTCRVMRCLRFHHLANKSVETALETRDTFPFVTTASTLLTRRYQKLGLLDTSRPLTMTVSI